MASYCDRRGERESARGDHGSPVTEVTQTTCPEPEAGASGLEVQEVAGPLVISPLRGREGTPAFRGATPAIALVRNEHGGWFFGRRRRIADDAASAIGVPGETSRVARYEVGNPGPRCLAVCHVWPRGGRNGRRRSVGPETARGVLVRKRSSRSSPGRHGVDSCSAVAGAVPWHFGAFPWRGLPGIRSPGPAVRQAATLDRKEPSLGTRGAAAGRLRLVLPRCARLLYTFARFLSSEFRFFEAPLPPPTHRTLLL